MNRFLDAALEYARTGWPVFPCVPRAKQPACLHGLHDATTDLDQIERWWAATPRANIGIATGRAFDVLDLDNADARVWARMQGIANRPEVETARGLHIYVKATGFGNRTALAPGADYRGRGGYAIAPPSLHPSGAQYRWRSGRAPRGQVPAAPRWLLHLLSRESERARAERHAPVPHGTATARGVASLRAMAERLATQTEGNRNALLFWCALHAADTGIDQSDVEIVLRDAAQQAGLGDTEIARTLHSAFRRWT
jgi:hypothetical protein